MRLERTAVSVTEAARADNPVRDAALVEVVQRRWVPPERVTVERSSGIEYQLLLERQTVPPAVSVWRLRAPFMFCPRWGRWGASQPAAGLGDAGEVLVELHKIQHVTLDLASKTHKALLLRVDREAGS